MTIPERLDQAMRAAGFASQSALARASGVPQPTINRILSGSVKGAPETSTLTRLAAACNVSFTWLLEGIGDPQREMMQTAPELLATIPGAMRVVIGDPQVQTFPVKLVTLRLQAGFPGFEADRNFDDGGTVDVPQQWIDKNGLVPACLIAIKVRGDSMEPMFFEDDVVVINIADTKPVTGSIYAINFDGQAVIKQMVYEGRDWWLNSFNPAHRRRRCAGGECVVIGKVVHQGSRSLIGKI